MFWGLRHPIQEILSRTGLLGRLGAERFAPLEAEALALAHRLAGADEGHAAACPLGMAAKD